MALVDLDEIGAIRGPITVVDSTFATPIGQRPLDHGVDLVLHSATKGIAGHNDATLGVVAGLEGPPRLDLGVLGAARRVRVAVRRAERAAGHPHAAACASRGRARPRCGWRAGSRRIPRSRRCAIPGLDSHPQRELAKRQMTSGGSMFAVELARRPRRRAPVRRRRAARAARVVARRPRDARDPSRVDDARRAHARRSAPIAASPTASSACRSASSTPTTCSPTSRKPSPRSADRPAAAVRRGARRGVRRRVSRGRPRPRRRCCPRRRGTPRSCGAGSGCAR